MINIGFIEEIIFRGFLYKMMEQDNVKTAIIVSSITFGIGHIINLLNGATLIPTLMQICYAISTGYLFVIIFYKSKSIIPCIIFSEVGLELLAVSLMFAMIAVATGLLIYNGMTKYKPVAQETMVNDFKQWQSGKPSDKHVKSQVSGIIWSIILILYFVISFATGAWYVTWVLFLVGIAAEQIARLCISLKKENGKEKEKSE